MNITSNTATQTVSTQPVKTQTLISVTALFFMWGFITSLNDILIPHLKLVFDLSYTKAMLVQFCFFGAYFLVSVPSGKIVELLGYKKSVGVGLSVSAIGCLLFLPAAELSQYWVFLAALFILASGITLLQVAANPLVTLMGPANTASSRLNMTQAFNSLGTTLAPIFGAWLIFANLETTGAQTDVVKLPYILIAITLFAMAAMFLQVHLPAHIERPAIHHPDITNNQPFSLFSHRQLMLGVIAIFVYVGAEVSIGSLLVNYLGQSSVASLAEHQAAHYVSFFWGGAMVGRFVGAALMQRINPAILLTVNGIAAIVFIVVSIMSVGTISMWAMLLTGLCNSIMFPTIFSLAIKDLGPHSSKGSGYLCLAIVGGAIVPLMQGILADQFSLNASYVLPILCYLYIAYFGLMAKR